MGTLTQSFRWDPSKLHFEFPIPNRETRFKELFLYIAAACREDPTFSSVKQNKVLFYSDFEAYGRYRKPITGIPYQRLAHGPSAKALVRLRDEMIQDNMIRFVKRPVHNLHRERAISLRDPARGLFTVDELAIVDKWVRFFWNKTSKEVSAYSHGKAWHIAKDGELIPYEAVFISDEPATLEDVARVKELAGRFGWKI
jgi:hypothetical protein